jgi:hypothetical protein
MQVLKGMFAVAALAAASAQAGTVVVSGGTTMVQNATGEESRLSSLQVNCASTNRTNVGFLCGFDDGQKTVLQFEEREGSPVRLFDADGREIAARRIGSYMILPQLYRMVFVRVGGKEAVLLRGNGNFVEGKQQIAATGGSGNVAARADAATGTAATPVPQADSPASPAVAVIKEGERIDLGLQAMAMAEGWKFIWYPTRSWKAANDIDLSKYKDAAEATIDVVNGLREEGKPVRWHVSDGNKVIEVISTEVKND